MGASCFGVIYASVLIGICASAVFSVVVLFRYPNLWLRSLALLTTSVALLIEPAVQTLNAPFWIFGRPDEGCGPPMGFVFVVIGSPFQIGFLLILIGSWIEERKHDLK
jgi:hypothetical protein